MKCVTVIDKEREEQVLISVHEKSRLSEEIERLVMQYGSELTGYREKEAVRLLLADAFCFAVEYNRVYVYTSEEKLQLKYRLYQLEERLTENFVKINQSCIVNIKSIKRFDASIAGTLRVTLKNGYSDYVSRRQLKTVKERLEI